MPSFIEIDLPDAKQLERRLDRIGNLAAGKAIRKAMRKAWRPVLDTAKAIVPYETGALHDELKLKALRRSRTRAGIEVATPERANLGIDSDDPGYYPAILEYGSTRTGQIAYPYLRPAFDQNRQSSLRIFETELARAVREALK